jgi:hypothetical protein
MTYETLEEAGELHFSIRGASLDLEAMATIHAHLLLIIDRVTASQLYDAATQEPFRSPRPLPGRRPIRTQIASLKSGSLYETFQFLVLTVFSDPDARAVLQNLAANAIWAIGGTGVRGIVASPGSIHTQPPRRGRRVRGRDPRQVAASVREILAAVDDCRGNCPAEVTFKSVTADETLEVTIRVGAPTA